MKSYILGFFAILPLFFVSCGSKSSSNMDGKDKTGDTVAVKAPAGEPGDRGYLVKIGDMAPDFTVSVDNNTTFKLSDYRGKVVMLQFTASWCGICRKEMPHIESDIWKRFGSNDGFCLLGIDREETADKVARLKELTGVTYPIAYDTDGSVFRLYAYPEAGITRNVLIDREGRIVMLTRRFEQEEFDLLCSKIAELIGL